MAPSERSPAGRVEWKGNALHGHRAELLERAPVNRNRIWSGYEAPVDQHRHAGLLQQGRHDLHPGNPAVSPAAKYNVMLMIISATHHHPAIDQAAVQAEAIHLHRWRSSTRLSESVGRSPLLQPVNLPDSKPGAHRCHQEKSGHQDRAGAQRHESGPALAKRKCGSGFPNLMMLRGWVMAAKKRRGDTTELVLRGLFCYTPLLTDFSRVGVHPDSVSLCSTRPQ